MKLSKFVPHPTITDAEIAESNQPAVPITFSFGSDGNQFQINGESYQSGTISQTLILGTAQVWKLASDSGSHPHHIHVNPFQVTRIINDDGSVVTDPQYQDMVGTWRDTIMVTENVSIEIRTRYERYIGEYVLHCHILGHEDQGMMQAVKVVLPDGKGGAHGGAHQH
ncbi:MAG: multicopper oxidase domain-containing protein [Gammaproteobacteria bacterium]|nr:multicopper oxidase domain-containing protein [Gammaproteobacteria bacterium]